MAGEEQRDFIILRAGWEKIKELEKKNIPFEYQKGLVYEEGKPAGRRIKIKKEYLQQGERVMKNITVTVYLDSVRARDIGNACPSLRKTPSKQGYGNDQKEYEVDSQEYDENIHLFQ